MVSEDKTARKCNKCGVELVVGENHNASQAKIGKWVCNPCRTSENAKVDPSKDANKFLTHARLGISQRALRALPAEERAAHIAETRRMYPDPIAAKAELYPDSVSEAPTPAGNYAGPKKIAQTKPTIKPEEGDEEMLKLLSKAWGFLRGAKKTTAPIVVNDQRLEDVRKRNEKELQRLNNKQTSNPEGFVYVITNPAWPGMVKIGCAIDPEDRVRGYQTYSPLRDYELHSYTYAEDRRAVERAVHAEVEDSKTEGEWFKMSVDAANVVLERVSDHPITRT